MTENRLLTNLANYFGLLLADFPESEDYVKRRARITRLLHAPVAQLDRVLASEAKGRWFDSTRARQFIVYCQFQNKGPASK